MTFWGIQVKPSKPYTLSFRNGKGRLHVSLATLARYATEGSSVQCRVGYDRPVLLCTLIPNKTESLQVNVEFDEDEDVRFSVLGLYPVYLTGYYVDYNRQPKMKIESELYEEDIGSSATEESSCGTFDDDYDSDDSFIDDEEYNDDDEPELLASYYVSSIRDDENDAVNKKRNLNGSHKKMCQSIEPDDGMTVSELMKTTRKEDQKQKRKDIGQFLLKERRRNP